MPDYGPPPKDYQRQVYGNRPNELVGKNRDIGIRFQIEEILKGVRTSMPGIVQKVFERDNAVWVEVQPGLSGLQRNLEEFKLPIVRAPLCKMNIAGFELDYPDPVQGDEVAIFCADRNPGKFIREAGVGTPSTVSILDLNNAWVIPFSFSNLKRKRKGNKNNLTLTKGDQKIEFTVTGTIINDGTLETARKTDTAKLAMSAADITALAAALLVTGAFVPTGSPPGPGTPTTFTGGEITGGTDKLLLP